MANVIVSALLLAREVQKTTEAVRKYSKQPYINHPLRVMAKISCHDKLPTEIEIAAAILHDVHEDPPYISLERIASEVHPQVARYVESLTNPSLKYLRADGTYPKEWPRRRRKELDFDHIASCDYWTQTIKAYDR